jgi:hypothetical protein
MMNTFKRTIALLVVFCLIAVLFPAQALALANDKQTFLKSKSLNEHSLKSDKLPSLKGSSVTSEGFIYTIKNDKVTIIGYKGNDEDITIPDVIEGKPVTTIAAYAFSNWDDSDDLDDLYASGISYEEPIKYMSINSVKIGPNITYIGKFAFAGQDIKKFTVDPANTKYSSDAGGALFDLDKTVLIAYPVGSYADSYTVPEGVTRIEADAFYYASNLYTVTLPQTLVTIGDEAFYSTYLKSLNIPKNVTLIGKDAFADLESLVSVSVDPANTKYASLDGVLFDKAQKTLLLYPREKTNKSYSIPATVTKIPADAIDYNPYLQVINIPASVTVIGSGAFSGCNLLAVYVNTANPKFFSAEGILFDKLKTHLIIYPSVKTAASYRVPGTVKYIDEFAFFGALLKTVILPDSLIGIGGDAFSFTQKLASITIPKNVTSMGEWAFGYSSIKSISFNSKMTSIPASAFRNCANLTSITLPKNIKSIGRLAFAGCYALKTATIPYTTVSIDDTSFSYYYEDMPSLTIRGCKNSVAQAYAKKLSIPFKSIGSTPKYKIKAAANNTAFGSVSGANKYYYGKTCKLKATPKAGCKFVGWTLGGKTVSTKAEYSFVVTKARTLKAVFAKK